MHLMISRVEGIGDVCLTLPAVGYIKQLLPDCKISMLVSPYSQAVASACAWLDEVVVLQPGQSVDEIASFLSGFQVSHFVHVTANKTLSQAAKQAKIPNRSGLAGRYYHLFTCTQLVWMSRAKSGLHEAYFNLLLLVKSLKAAEPSFDELKNHMVDWAGFRPAAHPAPGQMQVILHPYSRGHGREWPIQRYAELAYWLVKQNIRPVIGGTQADAELFASEQSQFPDECQLVFGQDTLEAYIQRIAQANALVASGTGPLHIASVMGQRCVGLFPPRKVVHSKRWGCLTPASRNLELPDFCNRDCSNTECACMQAITASSVADALTALMQPAH
jgi:ADP-heptose:LPS heptosyltransferase